MLVRKLGRVDYVETVLAMQRFTDSRTLDLAAENIHAIIDHARAVAMSGFGINLKVYSQKYLNHYYQLFLLKLMIYHILISLVHHQLFLCLCVL